MTRLMISGFAAIALVAATTAALRSHPPAAGRAGMISTQQTHAGAVAGKLPVEEFEDLSLVYSANPKP